MKERDETDVVAVLALPTGGSDHHVNHVIVVRVEHRERVCRLDLSWTARTLRTLLALRLHEVRVSDRRVRLAPERKAANWTLF